MEIAEFLLARIAEDEAVAKMPPPAPWRFVGEPRETSVYSEPTGVTVAHVWQRDAHHIARWDPARVLAECEAKRRVVERADRVSGMDNQIEGEWGTRGSVPWEEDEGVLLLRYLAVPYADHKDYQPEWKP